MLNRLLFRPGRLIAVLVFLVLRPAIADPAPTPAHANLGANPHDKIAAVIFDYQRIGEDLSPATNSTTDQFTAHIAELSSGGYHIAPLDEIVTALNQREKLPDRTVAITFDGAYKSALQNAIPLLLRKNIPFAVFFSPAQADADTPDYMNWADIKRLAGNPLVTLGLHPADYTRLSDADPSELRRQINTAISRYRDVLKTSPAYFSYPFGEYTKPYQSLIKQSGFKAAFGQQSGVAYDGSDLMALPRFALTENYGDDDRFRMIANALPLPVSDISPDDPRIAERNPPIFGFTLDDTVADKIAQLSCYISEQGKPEMQTVGRKRVELRVNTPFEGGRIRVNCTMPGPKPKPGEDQRWRWLGMLYTRAHGTPDEDLNTDPTDNSRPD